MKDLSALIGHLKEFLLYMQEKRKIRILKQHGMHIGKNVTIMPDVDFDFPYSHLISIGDNCSISRNVRIMVHDATLNKYLGFTLVEPVIIHDNCFIGERCILLPGVEIGPDAIVAAGSLVNKKIPAGRVAAGVPARVYANLQDFLSKACSRIKDSKIYEHSEFFNHANLKNIKEELMIRGGKIAIKGRDRSSLIYGGNPELIKQRGYEELRKILRRESD